MAGYLGAIPVPQATQHRESFTATAAQTTFNTAGYTVGFVDVYLNGVHLTAADVTATNGSDVVLGACLVNDIVDVISHSAFELNAQTFTGTTTMDVAAITGVLTTTAATVFNGGFAANDGSTITTADNTTQLTLISTDADASVGPVLDLYRNSASPADNDVIGRIVFNAENDADEKTELIRIIANLTDASNGSEDVLLQYYLMKDGTRINRLQFSPTETVFNDDSADIDFRVESNANANAIYVNANDENIGFGNAVNITQNGFYMHIDADNAHLVCANTQGGNTTPLIKCNRQTADGDLISFMHANSEEGKISISGTTVSYNGFAGRHESSGIATNTAIGTVVSTIDELDVYPNTTQNEALEAITHPKIGQTRADHAKVKVSDSIGDKRVYGVVDEFNAHEKVYVTSVGIAAIKVTGSCAGGDLLESNGDGTAKVQSDDIVRSKTIGKVTIGNSNTGVKLVSCVMYCG